MKDLRRKLHFKFLGKEKKGRRRLLHSLYRRRDTIAICRKFLNYIVFLTS